MDDVSTRNVSLCLLYINVIFFFFFVSLAGDNSNLELFSVRQYIPYDIN